MKFNSSTTLAQRATSELLVLPFWKQKEKAVAASPIDKLKEALKLPLASGDFTGKAGETLLLYSSSTKEKRLLLLGLGEQDEASVEEFRRAYFQVTRATQKYKVKKIAVLLPKDGGLSLEDISEGVVEGLLLGNYDFSEHKGKEHKKAVLIDSVQLVGANKKQLDVAKEHGKIAESVYYVRDLVNSNADLVTPQHLASEAKKMARKFPKVKATVFDKKRLEKEKMGLLLAVGRGSSVDPVLITLEYKGAPKSKEHTIVVGKGVTYDTGGLNIKGTGHMESMKCDMGGAGAALGTMLAVASLGLKVNLTVVIPSTENSVSGHSYKPGDVYTGYAGKTVEIGNTDAEGRLILADALAYAAKKLKPTRMIDFATLTGSIVIALGEEASGLFSNSDALADGLAGAGSHCFERVWRMPMYDEYRKLLDSDFADIKNVGGREGGSITAAWFLKEFVNDVPWAHIDIAGTAYTSKSRDYVPKNATGVGVRLMLSYLKTLG